MPVASYQADRLSELLAAAVIALAVPRTGVALPTNRYRSHNPPAVDFCNGGLLVTYLDSPAVALSDVSVDKAVNSGQIKAVPILRMVVELWRCVPNLDDQGTPPTATELDAAYAQLAVDEHALQTGLWLSRTAGTLFVTGSAMGCSLARLGDPIPLGPQGSMAGWRMRVTIPISDEGPPI